MIIINKTCIKCKNNGNQNLFGSQCCQCGIKQQRERIIENGLDAEIKRQEKHNEKNKLW